MGFKSMQLGDCITLCIDHRGKTPKKLGGDWSDSGYRAFSAKNIKTGSIVQQDAIRYVNELMYRKWMPDEIERGDILVTSEAPFGQVFIWDSDEKIVLSQRLFGIRPDSRICDPYFLYYWMCGSQFQGDMRGRATGTTVIGLRQPALLSCGVVLPDLETQRHTATFLRQLDKKITINRKINDYLYELIDSVFAEHFPCIDASGAPSIESIESLGFSPTNIGSLCKNVTDGTHSTVKDDPAGTCLLLSCKNVKNGALVTSDKDRRICEETLNKLRKRTGLAKGDILLTSVGTIGEMALLRTPPDNYEFQRSVALIKPDAKLVSSEFLYSYMRAIARHIRAQAHGAVQQCIFINDIKQIAAFNPGYDLIARFTETTRPMFDLISSNEEENRGLADLRDALLPKLMSGEIDVSEIELPTQPNNHL